MKISITLKSRHSWKAEIVIVVFSVKPVTLHFRNVSLQWAERHFWCWGMSRLALLNHRWPPEDRPQGAKEQAEKPLGRRRKCENADGLVKKADWIILNCYFGLTNLPSGKEGINVCLLPFLSHFSGPKNGNQANVSCVQSLFWFTNLFTFHVRKS